MGVSVGVHWWNTQCFEIQWSPQWDSTCRLAAGLYASIGILGRMTLSLSTQWKFSHWCFTLLDNATKQAFRQTTLTIWRAITRITQRHFLLCYPLLLLHLNGFATRRMFFDFSL